MELAGIAGTEMTVLVSGSDPLDIRARFPRVPTADIRERQ